MRLDKKLVTTQSSEEPMAIRKHPSITKLPTLFKRTNTGAIQEWSISVEGTTIVTAYGQVGGKIQKTADTLKSGKNAGRANATAPEEQALKEATSQWTKKKKSGYVESIGAAEAGETDDLIEGGVIPMLAKVYEEHVSKVTYPIAVQPKLDGHRCIAIIDCNKGKDIQVSLWTRTRKPINSVPHIENRLRQIAEKMKFFGRIILDGELYNHDMKDDFEKLTSGARKEGGNEHSINLQYHVYDMISELGFKERIGRLEDIILLGGKEVELVNTKFANSEKEAQIYFTTFQKLGYEGSMVRLLNMGYENKRSAQLLKVKTFLDEEFEVFGMEEGRGKLQGHCGAFVCKTKDGKTFKAKMAGETSNLKEFWSNPDKYIGRMLTVKFQGKTSDKIPRFPVGMRFREDL